MWKSEILYCFRKSERGIRKSVEKNVLLFVFYKEGLKEKAELYLETAGYIKGAEVEARQNVAADSAAKVMHKIQM